MLSPVTRILIHGRQVQRDLWILLATVAICSLPFLGQALHIDDNFYMDMARNALEKPLYPNDTDYTFHGIHLSDMGSHSHPPMQTYFLAFLLSVFGEGPGKETLYHLTALVFPAMAVVAMYFLSIRFVETPLWPSLVLAVTPVFMVMQHNLMTDLPMLAFWLSSTAAFLWATESRNPGLYLASALFAFAAMFTGYQAASLVLLLGFYLVRRGNNKWAVAALLLPVVLMASWFALQYLHYGRFLLWDTVGYVQSRDHLGSGQLTTKLFGFLGYQGWLVIFPLFPLLSLGRLWRGRLLAMSLLTAAFVCQLAVPDYRPAEKAIFIVGLTAGGAMVGGMFLLSWMGFVGASEKCGFPGIEAQFLGLWYWGVLAYCTLFLTEGSARYLLPLVPPLLLWLFRQLEVEEVRAYRLERRAFLSPAFVASGVLVLSLAWSLALSHADKEFAAIYPRVAGEIKQLSTGLPSYYAGEWGFRYYLHQGGVAQLPQDEGTVTGGSLVALPKLALPYDLPAALRSMLMPFQTITLEIDSPLRILDRGSHAGFYSTGWGLLPFSISRQPVERVEVSQVNFMVEQLPRAAIETSGAISPWPGYLSIDGRAPLALLAEPGTRVVYPWLIEPSVDLELKCGVDPGAYGEGDRDTYEFEIRQMDVRGLVISRHTVLLTPGLRPDDRTWQPALLKLRGRGQGESWLEFKYSSSAARQSAIGAFAEAFLRRPR